MTQEKLEKMAINYAETINLNNVNISGVVRNHIKYAVIVGYNACKQEMKLCVDCKFKDEYARQNHCVDCKKHNKWELAE